MAKKQKPPPTSEEMIHRMTTGMLTESDRGFALTVTAWLDDALGEVLRSRFINDQSAAQELLNGDSPLATFSARIKLLYCLGVIGQSVKQDLNIIRIIRNEFAHERGDLTFESRSVKDRCLTLSLFREFTSRKQDTPLEPRMAFMRVGLDLLTFLLEIAAAPALPQSEPDAALDDYLARKRALEPLVEKLLAHVREKVKKDRESRTGE